MKSSMYISQLFRKGSSWRYQKGISGGGVLITQNSHLLDLLIWIFGDIEWVSAHTQRLYSEEVEDRAHVYVGFQEGLEGWLDSSWSQRHHRTLTVSVGVQGENGTLEFSDDDISLFLDEKTAEYPQGWSRWKKPDLYRGVSFDVALPQYTRQAEVFVSAIRGGHEVESSVLSAYRVQCVLDAIYESARNRGTPVRINSSS